MSRLLTSLLIVLVAVTGFVLGRVTPAPVPAESGTTPTGVVDWSAASAADLEAASIFVVARDRGARAAMDSLQVIAARDSLIARRGHQLAHSVGRFVSRRGGNDPALLASCRPLFMAGCYHGVIEAYMASLPEVDPAGAAALCMDLETRDRPVIEVRECAHGLGHGLLTRLAYSFDASLAVCDELSTAVLREECYDGVFMQNLVRGEGLPTGGGMGEGHDHAGMDHGSMAESSETARFRADDLAYPCNQVAEVYQPACWSYQTVAIGTLLQDWGEPALRACATAPEHARARCHAGYGKQSMSWLGRDPSTLIDSCGRAPESYVDDCIDGVVEGMVDAEWGPDGALRLCSAVSRSGRSGVPCYRTLGERLSLLYPDPTPAAAACRSAVEPGYEEACREGAGLEAVQG
jgi:hypothetical protein